MEKLFTPEELLEIQNEAVSNSDYYHDIWVITGNSNERTIKTISKDNQLIFVEGNNDTGFKHLTDRHNYFSFKNYWIKSESGYRLDDPSKFHPKMTPLTDYVKICDAIYAPENKNITKNNHPDVFDKYTGIYSNPDGKDAKYHFLTYKGTKIIHTMFPDKKNYNVKGKTKYGRGIVTARLKIGGKENINDLLIPYENHFGISAYSILIRKFYNEKIERLIIQKHDENGEPIELHILGSRDFNDFESFSKEDTFMHQNADLSELEKIIDQFDQNGITTS